VRNGEIWDKAMLIASILSHVDDADLAR